MGGRRDVQRESERGRESNREQERRRKSKRDQGGGVGVNKRGGEG